MSNTETQLSVATSKSYYETQTEPLDLVAYNRQKVEKFGSESEITGLPNRIAEQTTLNTFASKKPTSVDEIYYQPEFTSAELNTGLRLLAECLKYTESAIEELRREHFFDSDDAVHHIQVRMPEIYCCRNLGAGFSAIINSLQNALNNNKGQPLSEAKLIALRSLLTAIRQEPFMKHNKAVDLIMDFEDHGFVVEPAGFEILAEIFSI